MKKSSLFPAVATLSLLLAGSSPAALVLHWKLDEASGTVAGDSSGNGITGNWQGTVGAPAWVPAGGISGGAFSFTGANLDSFITSSFSAVSTTPLTMSFWMKTTSTENDGLVYLGNGASGDQYYVARLTGGLARANARNTAEQQGAGTTLVNNDQWHHIVAVYAASNDRRIYVNGNLEGTFTTVVNPVTLTRFGIGALTRNTPYAPADLYTGFLDDVQLYSSALTPSDINFLRANPGATIPEPTAAMLLGLGLGFGAFRRRRRA